MLKSYLDLTKSGIVVFVILSGLAGYAVSLPLGQSLEVWQPLMLVLGLYFLSGGSFAINQAQEWKLDSLMPRTKNRPIVTGKIAPWQAYVLGGTFCLVGFFALYLVSAVSAYVGLATLVLYNIFYTYFWKKKMAFGAVPGAIPGALPVVIGYAVNDANILSAKCLYLFLIMFLWQMPHFWCLAIKYKKDYAQANFPVLPTQIGNDKTMFHIGLYTFVYVAVALVAPLFLEASLLYMLLVVPFALKVLFEFLRYYNSENEQRWLPFFLWVNFSLLAFIIAPVFDKWIHYSLFFI